VAGDFAVAGDGEKIRRKEVMEMPFGDGTGPRGLGPMTGKGAGFCAGFGAPGFVNPMPGYDHPYRYAHLAPVRPGFGRGFGRGVGRGWRRWGPYRNPWW
jgi:hypothetical protein